MASQRRWWGLGLVGAPLALVLACTGACLGVPCLPLGIRTGAWLDSCPAGEPRLVLEAHVANLVRGQKGEVSVYPEVFALQSSSRGEYAVAERANRGVRLSWRLLDAAGAEVPGLEVKGKNWFFGYDYDLGLPKVPDGDYRLQVAGDAGFDQRTLDIELPLYTPALAYLASDRPLYQPGDLIRLRGVLWKRTDLAPLEGRPGTWRIFDPGGQELLVERARSGDFGISETTFPLDAAAAVGVWRAVWESDQARDEISFRVEPFVLPRLSVEVRSESRWTGPQEPLSVVIQGLYATGAPVGGAQARLRLVGSGDGWPMPLAWEEPRVATTDAQGRARFEFGRVPGDLIGRVALTAQVELTDPVGETVRAASEVVLSQDRLWVRGNTDFGGALVGGFNNRVYLAVSSPDGQPLPGVELKVRPGWDASATPSEARTDEDGVAALQVDPGSPVTVVSPEIPARRRPPLVSSPAVYSAEERVAGRAPNLEEARLFSDRLPALARCGVYSQGDSSVTASLMVDRTGRSAPFVEGEGSLGACVTSALQGMSFGAGPPRLFRVAFLVPDPQTTSLSTSHQVSFGSDVPVPAWLASAARAARPCFAQEQGVAGRVALRGTWRVDPASRRLLPEVAAQENTGLPPEVLACAARAFGPVEVKGDPVQAGVGSFLATLQVPTGATVGGRPALARQGYELAVDAVVDGRPLGSTRVFFNPGEAPPLRVRPTPALATPGAEVSFELLRGPGFRGELPKKLVLRQGTVEVQEVEVAEGKARFQLPVDARGFYGVEVHGAQGWIFVQDPEPFAVRLAGGEGGARPGEQVPLVITTRRGERGVPAAVSLQGVDSRLGQLAPLLRPDDPARVTVRLTPRPDLGGRLADPVALALGRIQGQNAAMAALLEVASLPMDAAGDAALYRSARQEVDTTSALQLSFYRVLNRLEGLVRVWEASAPPEERLTPRRAVDLFEDAVRAEAAAGEEPRDGFGRRLSLVVLPPELRALCSPRALVNDARRLPEDLEDWEIWLAREVF